VEGVSDFWTGFMTCIAAVGLVVTLLVWWAKVSRERCMAVQSDVFPRLSSLEADAKDFERRLTRLETGSDA
jgi:hypothetical protein